MRSTPPPHPTAIMAPPPAGLLPGTPPAPRSRIAAVFGLLALIWGTTWLAIKVGLAYYPPFFSLACRFLAAGTLILLIMKIRGERLPRAPRHQAFFALLGLLSFVISFGVVYWSEQYLSSGLAAVIFALLPLLTGVVAHLILAQERLHPARWAGLVIGLAGIVVINASDLEQIHPRAPAAALVLMFGPLATAVSTVLSKRRIHEFHPLAMAGFPMLYGGLVHLGLCLTVEPRPWTWSWPGVASIAYLTLFGSIVTFSGYYWLLRRLEVSRLNLMAYVTPLVALSVGFVFLHETPTWPMAAGAALVLTGVAVANRAR